MYKILIFSLVIILLSGCNATNDESVEEEDTDMTAKAEYRKISPEEAKELMVEGNLILDVRTMDEYNQGYIRNAVLHPVDLILGGNYQVLPDKEQIILVYCRSGNRSSTAANALVEAGYTQVYDFGGIIDWPYDIVTE